MGNSVSGLEGYGSHNEVSTLCDIYHGANGIIFRMFDVARDIGIEVDNGTNNKKIPYYDMVDNLLERVETNNLFEYSEARFNVKIKDSDKECASVHIKMILQYLKDSEEKNGRLWLRIAFREWLKRDQKRI